MSKSKTSTVKRRALAPVEKLKLAHGGSQSASQLSEVELLKGLLHQINLDEPPPGLSDSSFDAIRRLLESIADGETSVELALLLKVLSVIPPDRIKRCERERCRQLFYANRKDKRGCSPQCCNVIRTLLSRTVKVERAAQYQAAQNKKRKNTRKAK